MPELECKFTCDQCNIKEAIVYVAERKAGQDVREWMETVCVPTICEAHQHLSPHCRPQKLTNLMIPLSEKGVGFLPTGNELQEGVK